MPDSDIKWDEILNGVMKEGKLIKKRHLNHLKTLLKATSSRKKLSRMAGWAWT